MGSEMCIRDRTITITITISTSTSSSSSSSSSISILKAQLSMLKETNRMDKLTYYCYDATSIYYLVYYITHTDTEVY